MHRGRKPGAAKQAATRAAARALGSIGVRDASIDVAATASGVRL